MNTVIYYGSTTGTCEDLANRLASAMGGADVKNASELGADAANYDLIILGTSTWGEGDLQDDWYDALETMKGLQLAGKKVAVFGVGDCESYPDTFCGAMKALYDAAKEAGAEMVGSVDAADYNYSDSASVVDGRFVGLALDETNEGDKTDDRIAAWVASLK